MTAMPSVPSPSAPSSSSPAPWRRALLAAVGAGLLALAGCSTDISSIRRAEGLAAPAAADEAVATGRIQFLVDGAPMRYGLLDKPHLQLFHRGRGQLMSSPETDAEGRFRWQLPAGDYGVAVIFGGKAPTGQPHRVPSGALLFVNGLVDPGLEFVLQPGRVHELGTLVVEVESKPAGGLLNTANERVFARLVGVRVEPATPAEAGVDATPMRRIAPRR